MIHDSHKDSLSLSRTSKYFLLSLLCISFARDQLRNTQSPSFFFASSSYSHSLGGNNRIIHVFIYSTAMCCIFTTCPDPLYYLLLSPPPRLFFISFSRIFWAAPPFWPLPFLCSVPYTNEMNLIQQRHLIFIVGRLFFSLCCIIPCRRPFL
jgi:hypothetical protein